MFHLKMNRNDLKVIGVLALPVMAETILQTFLGTVDTLFAGQISDEAIAAVGVTNLIVNIFIAFFTAVSVGTLAVIGRYVGRSDTEKGNRALQQSVLLSLFIGLSVGVLNLLLYRPILEISAGTLIILATYLGGLLQGLKFREISVVFGKTIKQMGKTAITVCSIVGLAKVMGYSGMITSIAIVLVAVTGGFYPLIAPIIGALGTFVTGSDTSANVLFGELQVQAASSIGADPFWIAAANMAGATAE